MHDGKGNGMNKCVPQKGQMIRGKHTQGCLPGIFKINEGNIVKNPCSLNSGRPLYDDCDGNLCTETFIQANGDDQNEELHVSIAMYTLT